MRKCGTKRSWWGPHSLWMDGKPQGWAMGVQNRGAQAGGSPEGTHSPPVCQNTRNPV